MRLKTLVQLVLGIVVMSACTTHLITHLGRRPDFTLISLGMNKAQILLVFGEPAGVAVHGNTEDLLYTYAAWYDHDGADGSLERYYVRLVDNALTSFGPYDQLVRANAARPKLPPPPVGGRSTGTGFAVTSDGMILTAFHVIEGARKIRVTFDDGRSFSAAVESSSQNTDLAFLKVDAKGLTALPMSSSRSINVGEGLFTVGYPVTYLLGKDAKYTSGALSSKSGIKGDASLMQITVPIQPGNSGGPVVTSKGQVVGIVTSTAAIEAFFKVTGSLPQNINWAIKAEYANLMFEANDKIADTPSLDKAIERAMKAVCLVEVWTETK
jgi:S1-C subfamily serine protease